MESWNDGIMGLTKIGHLAIDIIFTLLSNKNDALAHSQTFQYSTIPSFQM